MSVVEDGDQTKASSRATDAGAAAGAGAFGPNAWLVEDMYDRYLADPTSVSDSWREFFADYRPAGASPSAPTSAPTARPTVQGGGVTGAASPPAGANGLLPPAEAAAAARAVPSLAGESSPAGGGRSAPGGTAPAGRPDGGAADVATPLRGAAARIVANMEASLSVPTATSVRVVPAKLLEVNRTIINNQLFRTNGGKVSFTHLIGYAVVKSLMAVPAMNASFVDDSDGKGTPGCGPPWPRRTGTGGGRGEERW